MNDAKLFAVTFYQFEVDLGVIKYRSRAAGPLTVPHFINISPILHKTMSTASPPAPIVTFKKAPRRPQASRKRSTSPSLSSPNIASSSTSESNVIRPTKKSLVNPLIQGTKRRRDPTEENAGLDEMEYRADEGLIGGRADVYATRSTDYDLDSGVALDEAGRRELGEKKVRLNEDGEIDDGLYRGAANYLPTINKRADVLDKKMKTGPIRATANIRSITLVDYQPDVCKDYKETGFCGYGDSCKFLHDRGDYLAGWQLDKLDGAAVAVPQEEEEEEVPFACLLCRKEFTEPVVTKCGHYFCMKCAIDRFIKSPKCYACGAPTSGIFNKAERILAKLEAKNKKKREERGIVDDEEKGDGGIQFGGASDEEGEEEEGGQGRQDEEDDDD